MQKKKYKYKLNTVPEFINYMKKHLTYKKNILRRALYYMCKSQAGLMKSEKKPDSN